MGVQITALKAGFRRCGVAHSKEPKIWPDNEFTARELKILEAEPNLRVEMVKDKEKKTNDGGEKAGNGSKPSGGGKG